MPLRHALALGLLQGPAELLPVSSSAHAALVPWLAGWPAAELDTQARNDFEVALHAGTAAALLIAWRREAEHVLRRPDRRRLGLATLALGAPALAGALLERRIERRPDSPRAIAAGLAIGGIAMAVADTRPQARTVADACPRDALALGLAQALALLPGVSRNGATLTAARLRRFKRQDAQALSWRAGMPVIVGASVLKGRRLLRRRHETHDPAAPEGPLPDATNATRAAGPAAAGAAAAFLSTLASAPHLDPMHRARPLLRYSLYRLGLAALVLRRLRAEHGTGP